MDKTKILKLQDDAYRNGVVHTCKVISKMINLKIVTKKSKAGIVINIIK